jgi:Zn-dependent oligopeptidase
MVLLHVCSEVVTLFHEFGHGLQTMLTTETDVQVSGISGIEQDAIEQPSQFLERWCASPCRNYSPPPALG